MIWSEDERAIVPSPFEGAATAALERGDDNLATICKQIVKEMGDPFKIMPSPRPSGQEEVDAFNEPYYCAKSPSVATIASMCEDDVEDASSSTEEDEQEDPESQTEKCADPKPFFYT